MRETWLLNEGEREEETPYMKCCYKVGRYLCMVCTLRPNCLVIIPLHRHITSEKEEREKRKKKKKKRTKKSQTLSSSCTSYMHMHIYRYVNGYLEKKRQKVDMYNVREVMYLTSLLIPSLSFKKNRIASHLFTHRILISSHLAVPRCGKLLLFFFSSFVYSYISFIVHRPSSIVHRPSSTMFDERSSSSNSSSSSAGGCR